LRLERALDVQVEFGLREAFDERVHVRHETLLGEVDRSPPPVRAITLDATRSMADTKSGGPFRVAVVPPSRE
jgi:hypothetical protein